jgi:hypothetical protein
MKCQINLMPDIEGAKCMQLILSVGEFIENDSKQIAFIYTDETFIELLESSFNVLLSDW